jgi:hypothetical protein
MNKILYIHGWLSSGDSNTSKMLKNTFKDYKILCPDVPVDPLVALKYLQNIINKELPEIIIASSMGAFYANLLRGPLKILINPAFNIIDIVSTGEYSFFNKRIDNIQSFTFTEKNYTDLKQLQLNQFDKLSWEDKKSTYVIIGSNDTVVTNITTLCKRIYTSDNVITANFGHRINSTVVDNFIKPIVDDRIKIAENINNFNSIGGNEFL